MLLIVIVSGFSFFAINFTNDIPTDTAEISDLTIMNVVFAESDNTAKLVKHTNMRGEAVFVLPSTASVLFERGYLISNNTLENTSYDLNKRWSHTPTASGNLGAGISETIPWYELNLPQYVKVGEEFEISIPYTFVKYDDEDGTIPIEEAEIDEIIKPSPDMFYGYTGTELVITYPEPLVFLNPNDVDKTSKGFNYDWQKYGYSIQKEIHYDVKTPHDIKLQFLLNGTVGYPFHDILIKMGQYSYTELFINDLGNGTYEISETKVLPNYGPGENPTPCEICPRPPSKYSETGSSNAIPLTKEQDFEMIAEAIRTAEDQWWLSDGKFQSLEEMLRYNGDDWADEFLKIYPEFVGRFILSMIDWSIPEAHAQLGFFIVHGDVKVEELPNRFVNPSVSIEYCIEDKNLTTNTLTTMNKLGGYLACEELENGQFTILMPTSDPDGDGTTPDFVVTLKLKNENIILKDNTKEQNLVVYSTDSISNPKSVTVNFRNNDQVRIDNKDIFFQSYNVFKITQDTLTKFHNIGARNMPVLNVYYDTDPNMNSIGQYFSASNSIHLDDYRVGSTVIKRVSDYPVWISHEVGHFLQDAAYKYAKSLQSGTPDGKSPTGCVSRGVGQPIHDSNIITNQECAWSEGWATFVGIYANNSPNHTSFVTGDNNNFESGTKNDQLFPTSNGDSTEGWITAALWDIHDSVDETRGNPRITTTYDKIDALDSNLWTAFSTDKVQNIASPYIASNIHDFKADWDALNYPDITPIFNLNYISDTTSSVSPTTSNGLTTIFSDTFDNLDAWTKEGELNWRTGLPDEGGHPPDHPITNTVAETDDCDDECILVLTNSLDLTSYSTANLTLYRYVDNSLDSGEYLKIDVSSNGGTTWSNIFTWAGGVDDDDTWHKETFDLASYLGSSDFTIRAVAKASSSSEDLIMDSLNITGAKNSVSSNAQFSDDFESGFSKWTLSAEDDDNWEIITVQRPGASADNKVAQSSNCDRNCYMVSNSMDTTGQNAKLSFYRFISTSIDNGEGLRVHVSTNNGTTWTELVFLSADNDKDDSTWTNETIDLSSYQSNQLKVKFNAVSSSSSEIVSVDDIVISLGSGTVPPQPSISFSEEFDNLDSWSKSGDDKWSTVSTWREGSPTTDEANKFATAHDCDNTCTLTLTNHVDLSSLGSASLEISRFVDRSLDDDEYMGIDIYDGSR